MAAKGGSIVEANTMPERPWTVTTAVYLLYVSLVFPLIGLLPFWLDFGEADSFTVAFWGSALLGSLVISTLLYYLIGRGKTWARTTLLVVFVLTTPPNIWTLAQYDNMPELAGRIDASTQILGIADVALQLVALAFLFQQMSSEWFKAMKIHSQQLRTSA
jgi:hypothetical protein